MNLFIILKFILLTFCLNLRSVSATEQAVGYFSEGVTRVLNDSLIKDPYDLAQLLKPTKAIATRMDENGQLSFLGDVAKKWLHTFFKKLNESNYSETQSYIKYLQSIMENRRMQCSAELNEIIDLADLIISNPDGRHINALIDEYQQFPKVNKTGEQLSRELLEAFVKPFLENNTTKIMQDFVDDIKHLDEGVQCDPSFKTKTIYDKANTTSLPVARTEEEEGYIIQAYLKFLEVIIDKKDLRVRQIFRHTTYIVGEKHKRGEFDWMMSLKHAIPDVIGSYFQYTRLPILKAEVSARYYKKMKRRRIDFDEDINDLIDFGNNFITDDQKDELFEVVGDFEKFPISTRNGKELCEALIDAFSKPFKENKKKLKFENFVYELKRILRREYPDEKYRPYFGDDKPGMDDVYW